MEERTKGRGQGESVGGMGSSKRSGSGLGGENTKQETSNSKQNTKPRTPNAELQTLSPQSSSPFPHPSSLLFVFLDGVGLGEENADNPLAVLSLPAFERLTGEQRWLRTSEAVAQPRHVFRAIDARLGVEGLPQSGTGQAALFTGTNAPRLAGRHYGPYPHSKTRAALAAENVFSRILRLDLPLEEPVAFANAYPARFFDYARQRDRWTVTTRCCLDADVRIRSQPELDVGLALTADLTGQAWRERLGLDVRVITEEEAGARLVQISRRHAFTLFEYYLTDKAGHSRDPERAQDVLQALDRFFAGLLSRFDSARDLLLVTSDHGNLEDLSVKSHTLNAVPLIAYGRGASYFRAVHDLTGVTPAVVEALREG